MFMTVSCLWTLSGVYLAPLALVYKKLGDSTQPISTRATSMTMTSQQNPLMKHSKIEDDTVLTPCQLPLWLNPELDTPCLPFSPGPIQSKLCGAFNHDKSVNTQDSERMTMRLSMSEPISEIRRWAKRDPIYYYFLKSKLNVEALSHSRVRVDMI